ncbi:MAG: oxidoreductase [Chloroflexi bacterium HGW-Chloroflexi-10]|nr:MAG: oxidoreductase [Chloroflexi bacterium HGW-Chloroflexi-10]
MTKALVFLEPHKVGFESLPVQQLAPAEVLIHTLFSGISAGTEMTQFRGTSPFLHKRWDVDQRLFIPDEAASLSYPIRTLGYEESGKVVAVGSQVQSIQPGDLIFGTWGHRTRHIATEEYALAHRMPPGLDPMCGIFSHIGAIALNGIHDGRIRIGDTVAVFGLGVLGQIVVQAAKKSGARVIAVDMWEMRLEMARAMGADITLKAVSTSVAETIRGLTQGRGADVCFEVSGSVKALNEAIRAAAYSARVVAMGFFQGEANQLYLGEEFHHNRINLVCSQIGGVDPELKYRWDKLRLWQSAIQLQADGVLNLLPLITHRAPFDQAAALFERIDQHSETVLQAVLEFPQGG